MAHFEQNNIQPATPQEFPLSLQVATAAGFIYLTHPFWRIQGIQQVQRMSKFANSHGLNNNSSFSKTWEIISQMDGFSSLWRGSFSATLEAIIFMNLQLKNEEKMKKLKMIPGDEDKRSLKSTTKYFLGIGALYFASSLVKYPFMNIWVRLATDIEPVPNYTGFWNCVINVFKEEGLSGFYVGYEYSLVNDFIEVVFKTLKFAGNCTGKDEKVTKKWVYYPLDFLCEGLKYPFEVIFVRKIYKKINQCQDVNELEGLFDGFLIQISQNVFALGVNLMAEYFGSGN